MNLNNKLIFTSFVLLISFLLVHSIFARTTYSSEFLLNEDFSGYSNGQSPPDWFRTISNHGYWKIENGEFVGYVDKQGDHMFTYTGSENWVDYSFEVSITGLEGVDRFIHFRVNPASPYPKAYYLKYTDANYGFDSYIEVGEVAGEIFLNKKPYTSMIGSTHTFKIVVQKNTFQIFEKVNSNYILLFEYEDNIDPMLSGGIGFQIHPPGIEAPNTKVSIDNIIVTKLDSTRILDVENLLQTDERWANNQYGGGGYNIYYWRSWMCPNLGNYGAKIFQSRCLARHVK